MRLAHIVEWDRSGQSCVALIDGDRIVARFRDWKAAGAAYRAAYRAAKAEAEAILRAGASVQS